jgi:hypothetical protein
MSDLEKRWDTKLPLSVSMHVLRRPVETAGQTCRLQKPEMKLHLTFGCC